MHRILCGGPWSILSFGGTSFLKRPPPLTLFLLDVLEEKGIAYHVTPPHPFRFNAQPVHPFHGMILPPSRSTDSGAGIEIKHGPDGAHMAVDVQFLPMAIGPLFLLGCCHAYPQQVGVRLVDGLDDGSIVLLRELWLVGRRIGHHLKIRVIHRSPLPDQSQHFLRRAHEHHLTSNTFLLTFLFESFHL